uniref:mitogen-activated protein kinase kinase n=1 Tax=Schistosoma mansoni TaxID=6183 RepID=A0A3Q0KPZ7_SCHMA
MVIDQTLRLDKTSAGEVLETQSEKIRVEDISQETVSITISESLTDGIDASTTVNSQSTNHENKSGTLQTFTRCKSPTNNNNNNNNSLSSSSNATSIEYSQTSSPGDSGRRRLVPDFNIDDLLLISELGRGNGGIVTKLQHKSSGTFLIRKTFELDVKTTTRAQIVRDLQVLWECISPHIIEFHGAIHSECLISIYMEYMDVGGMDLLLKMVGRFPEPIIIHIADSVVSGLLYLWQELHMFHRNLKPSNILINRAGTIKLCDFVVSLQLSEYVASGFLGFSTYIAPERLAGELFTAASDIWSLGLTLMELAIGQYPIPSIDPVDFVRAFAPDQETNMLEHFRAAKTGELLPALTDPKGRSTIGMYNLFTYIVEQPAPRLPVYCFSSEFIYFIHSCLQKDTNDRLSIEIIHRHFIPDLIKLTCPHSSHNTLRPIFVDSCLINYLRGVFARQQAEAIDAVALAVGEDFDSIDTDFEVTTMLDSV